MRQKELRLALVCYGGVSLAVYMHGVTKEIWHLARASRDFHSDDAQSSGVEGVYRRLLSHIEREQQLRLRVLPDVITGASAGGINAVFLADAVHSGHSLEPLTELWLRKADIDELIHPDARPMWRFAKFWAQPLVWWLMRQPGSAVAESVAPETRSEVTRKLSRLVRGRWFEPPFSGPAFSHMLFDAIDAMRATTPEKPLLPPRHPIDLVVTATDFRGHVEQLRLHSPRIVEETEHRLPIRFSAVRNDGRDAPLADAAELTLAARATASFPGAFPPLTLGELDGVLDDRSTYWHGRQQFLSHLFGKPRDAEALERLALIDGSVLVNAPFSEAIRALRGRPAQREVDRRVVYIDPRPDRMGQIATEDRPIGFVSAIFGSLSTIPREQPIRDNLEELEMQTREAMRLRRIIALLRPEVERTVDKLFGRTLFFDRPTPRRLRIWRAKAQQSAADQAGYAFHSYAQSKFTSIVERLAQLVYDAAPQLELSDATSIEAVLRKELHARGLDTLADPAGGATPEAIAFMRAHDLSFRIRRMRLLARRLSRDWESDPDIPNDAIEAAHEAIYPILSMYFAREQASWLGEDWAALAGRVFEEPGKVLDALGERRLLPETDERAEEMLSEALIAMPQNLRRQMLLAYLGFPYYDVATFPLIRHEGFTEFDPIKVDRISPDDAVSIRRGGTRATLKGIEFYNFGAFFSRTYRENDYLWGRLHGAERMIDLVCSTMDERLDDATFFAFKRDAFLAILDEEEGRLTADPSLVERIRKEVLENVGPKATPPDDPSALGEREAALTQV